MELYNGRPEDTSGRKEKEIKVYDILDSLHIPYIRADHEAVMTMEACEEIDKALGMEICKNLFLCNRKNVILSAFDARKQSAQDKRTVTADPDHETILCIGRRHGNISECNAGLSYCHGTDL